MNVDLIFFFSFFFFFNARMMGFYSLTYKYLKWKIIIIFLK